VLAITRVAGVTYASRMRECASSPPVLFHWCDSKRVRARDQQ